MDTYNLSFPDVAIDAILATGYELQNAGYIFRGVASEQIGTPSERSWVLAGEGETGHGFTSPVPKGYIGVCVFDGTSWTGKLLKCVSIDSTPTSGSTNAVSSGGAYASISQLAATVNEALDNLTFTDSTPSAFLGEYIREKVSTTAGGIERILTFFDILAATAEKAGLLSAADKQKIDSFIGIIQSMTFEDSTPSSDIGTKISEDLMVTIDNIDQAVATLTILAATASKAGLMSAADKVKVDSFLGIIQSLTFEDSTPSSDVGTKISEDLMVTIDHIDQVLATLTILAATTSQAGLMSAADKVKLNALYTGGYKYGGIATPSGSPLQIDGKFFYIAIQEGIYTNFGGISISEGISVLRNDGNVWQKDSIILLDSEPVAGSGHYVKSGGVAAAINAERTERISAINAERTERISAINAERTQRISSDNSLTVALNDERSQRQTKDNSIESRLNTEINSRKREDEDIRREVVQFEESVRTTVDQYKPIVIQGDVTNAPDEVDLTTTPDHLLKFKDNIFNPVVYSGLGRIYLRKNIIPDTENYPFDGFVEDVPVQGMLTGDPDGIFWDRINLIFVAEKDSVYYNAWTDDENYVPARQDVIYMNNGVPYQWDGDDFVVNETTVPNLKNILTQAMLPYDNTIYYIRWDYDLNGEDIAVPENSVIFFLGGSLKNGSLSGEAEFVNMPDGLLAELDCSSLDIKNFPHISNADVFDFYDYNKTDNIIGIGYYQHVRSSANYYSVVGINYLYYIHPVQNAPTVRYTFYDDTFSFVEVQDPSTDYVKEVPAGAKYVRFELSFPRSAVHNMGEIMKGLYLSILSAPKVPIQYSEEIVNSDELVVGIFKSTAYINVSGIYYNAPSTAIQSVCIPYAIFKDYKYLYVKSNGTNGPRIHILKEEPTVSGSEVKYSDWYPSNVWMNVGTQVMESITLPIPSDARFIVILCGNNETVTTPSNIRLYRNNANKLKESQIDNAVNQSLRDTNIVSYDFVHWNVGKFTGGQHSAPIIDDSNYDEMLLAYNTFFAKHDCAFFFNEYNEVFANVNGQNIIPENVLYTIKNSSNILPTTVFGTKLAAYHRGGLLSFEFRPLSSLKGQIYHAEGSDSDKRPYYSVGVAFYRYTLGNTTIFVLSVHFPANRTDDEITQLMNEVKAIASYFPNCVIVGDLNISDRSKLSVLTDAGFTILNGVDGGGNTVPTYPASDPTSTLDWCLYKVGSDITVNGFEVLDADHDGPVDGEGNPLSDHWPIKFHVSINANAKPTVTSKGAYRFNPKKNLPEWSDGDKFLDVGRIGNITSLKILSVGDSILRGARNGDKAFFDYITTNFKTDDQCAISRSSYNNATDNITPTIIDIPQQIVNLKNNHPNYYPDIVITGTAVNDWLFNGVLGTLPTAPVTNDTDAEALDRGKVYDAIQYAFYKLVSYYPKAQRFFIPVMKFDCYVSSIYNGKYSDDNANGYSYEDLVEGIKKLCNLYGVVYIDVFNESFVNTLFEEYKAPTTYSEVSSDPAALKFWNETYYCDKDGLHPTDLGYREAFAPVIMQKIRIGTYKE